MKRMMPLISFLLCLCFCGTALATDPIWVDGQGNIITGGTTISDKMTPARPNSNRLPIQIRPCRFMGFWL